MNVFYESNIIHVSFDTWWLDSGATIQACNYMQAVKIKRSPTSFEQYVYVGDGTKVQVDFLGVVGLQLSIGNFFGTTRCGIHILYQEKFDINTYFG